MIGPNPLDNACCKNLIKCAKRTRSNPVCKKKVVDPAIIKSIIDKHRTEEASVKDLRIAAISSLGFAGFLLLTSCLIFSQSTSRFVMVLLKVLCQEVKQSDVYREGTSVYIAKLEGKYCPVAILRRYIEAANLDLSSHLPLFRPLTKTKSGYSLRNAKLSYTRCREMFKTTLKDLGYDPKDYGIHSLRSGGATADISNNASKAVSDHERLLKLHGRWKTDEAKDMYVLESECNRLSVTKYLGI